MKILFQSLVMLCVAASAAAQTAPGGESAAATNSRAPLRVTDLFTNAVVAKADGVTISRAQLDDAVSGIRSAFAARGQNIPVDKILELERQVLQRLIQVQLLARKANDADKAAGREGAEKRIADMKKQAGSDEVFVARLKGIGLTEEELRTKMTEELTAESVVKRELNVKVSDEEMKKYYEDNPGRFEQPESVKIGHVVIATIDPATRTELSDEQKAAKRRVADDVLKRARAGEDFTKLATEFSDDPSAKTTRGEFAFAKGQGQVPPALEGAAFSMKTNQISDIVTTEWGYHIIKTLEKIPAKKLELSEVETQVKDFLTSQAIQKQLPAYLQKLEKEANVEIVDEGLKAVALPAPAHSDDGDHTGHNH